MGKEYNWTIYKIENPKGKIYIGVTSNFRKRLNYYTNHKGINRQKRLSASLVKYGCEEHRFSILEEFVSDSDYALGKEMVWIRTYMTNYCKWPEFNGLNLTDGGQGTIGYKASIEHRQKLSEIHKKNPNRGFLGKKHTTESIEKMLETQRKNKKHRPQKEKVNVRTNKEETRRKQSLAKIGKPPPNKGKPMPHHQKELLRKINTGRPSWNKGKKYEGTDEERKVKFGAHNIGNKYNKGRKHPQYLIEARVDRMKKKIIQYSLCGIFIKEHESIKSAHQELGISASTIGSILNGETQSPKKYIFKYKT